ncbi:MAG: DUF3592 domain-containing protein, partial [Clostridia bacterium]|nr:DUF3592 domain-containing protein [Clostridia bacterium]
MNDKSQKRFLIIFLSVFIVVGLGLAIYGFVLLGQYNAAEEVQATVISSEFNSEGSELNVKFTFERDGKEVTAKGRFSHIKYVDGRLPYYEGLQTTVRVNKNNKVVTYGSDEIMITVSGGLFILFGFGFMYFMVLRKKNFVGLAYAYEQAMVNPEELTDEMQRVEAEADQLTKLPANSLERMSGELKVEKKRFSNRLATFTVAENVLCTILLVGSIVACCILFRSIFFGIIFGLFGFCFVLILPLKIAYNLYYLILVR